MVLNVLLLLNDQAATSTLSVRWGSLEQRSWAAGNRYRAPGIATGQRATGVARGQRALPGGQLPVARGQDFGSRCLSIFGHYNKMAEAQSSALYGAEGVNQASRFPPCC